MNDWIACESRGPYVRNSLKHKISELRSEARRARDAYRQDYMKKPCTYIADAYDEAADLLQSRLAALTANAEGKPPQVGLLNRFLTEKEHGTDIYSDSYKDRPSED
jgi:hypothetical protein